MNTKMNKLITLILLIALCACKKDSAKSILIKETPRVVKTDSIKNRVINIVSCTGFIENWAEIVSFETELKRVLGTTIQTEKDIELLKKLLEDLKKTYPERFKTQAIEARVKVLETEILMLEQYLKDGSLDDLNQKLTRVQNTYNIFVGQIEALILKEKDYEKYH
jgi:chromosome segregation ATPase